MNYEETNDEINPLLTKQQFERLKKNGENGNTGKDHVPVMKLHIPITACTWLLTELIPDMPHIAFGLLDNGIGKPKTGYVDLDRLAAIEEKTDIQVKCDKAFVGIHPLSIYKEAAQFYNQAVTDEYLLKNWSALRL